MEEIRFFLFVFFLINLLCQFLVFTILIVAGDVEFKQNKSLPADRQIVTANPDIKTVCGIWTSAVFVRIGVKICETIF